MGSVFNFTQPALESKDRPDAQALRERDAVTSAVEPDLSTANAPKSAVRRSAIKIDPKDPVAMRESLAREVIDRAHKKTMAFDGVYRDELLSMSPDEVVERFLAIVKKRQGAPAAEALDLAIKSQQQQDALAAREARDRKAQAAVAEKPTKERATAEKASLPAKPQAAPSPALDRTPLPLNGAAKAQVMGEIFHQASQQTQLKRQDKNGDSSPKPTRLGISSKAIGTLNKLDKRTSSPSRPEATNTVASNGMRLIRT